MFFVGRGLAKGRSPAQGILRSIYMNSHLQNVSYDLRHARQPDQKELEEDDEFNFQLQISDT